MPKLFQHDCDNCIYLGSNEGLQLDFYAHMKGDKHGLSLIARDGDGGPDYSSMWISNEKWESYKAEIEFITNDSPEEVQRLQLLRALLKELPFSIINKIKI